MTQSIEEFLEKIDIVEVISHYIPLKRVGSNYMAPCPFHNETKPSFSVSPTRQFYHCFGCNAGGNSLSFVQNFENIAFKEAVQILSQRYNVPFTFARSSPEDKEKHKLREDIQHGFSYLFSLFHQNLLSGTHEESLNAVQYLKKRGFDRQSIENFQLGYIPSNGELVIKRLRQNFRDLNIFTDLGILGKRQDGRFYCKLTGRITFPIYDQLGRGIALGARVLNTEEPKYINSPENILFQKSRVFYGWHLAKTHVNKQHKLIICEGYFDVIRLHQKGFEWSVATLGTALTEHHAVHLKRTGSMVYLVFDADEAGVKAALRGVGYLLPHDIPHRIIVLPRGEDPDSFLQSQPPESFADMLNKGYNIIELLYKHALDTEGSISPEKKNEIIRTVLALISSSHNAILREEYLELLSKMLGVGYHSLLFELRNFKKIQQHRQTAKAEENHSKPSSPQKPEEKILKKLISIFILDTGLAELYKKAIDFTLLEDNLPKQTLLTLLGMKIKQGERINTILEKKALLSEHRALIRNLLLENEAYLNMEEHELAEQSFAYIIKLAFLELKKKVKEYKNRISLAKDDREKKELFEELCTFIHYKDNPREYLQQKLKDLKNDKLADLDT